MRTTVRLRDGLLKQARKICGEHDTTLTSMLIRAFGWFYAKPPQPTRPGGINST